MRVRRFVLRFAALWLVAALSALPAASAPDPYVIDVVAPLTGTNAFSGNAVAEALRVFEAYANAHGGLRGQPIHFEPHDDQSAPAVSVQLTTQLMAKHPAVILGSVSSGLCGAMQPLAAKEGPVLYCLVPSIYPPKDGYVFSAGIAVDPFINGMIRYFRLRGFTHLAVISSTDGAGQTDDTSTRRSLELSENKGLEIVTWQHFNPTDINLTAQATAVKNSNAQAILIWTAGTAFGTVLRSLNDAGVNLPIETTNANSNVAQLNQYLTFLPKDMVMSGYPYMLPAGSLPEPMRKPLGEFFDAYRAAHLKPSPGAAPTVWDTASIVLSGLRKIGPAATATQLRDYILGLHDYAGIDGIYDFGRGDQHGLSDQSVVMIGYDPKTQDWFAASGLGGAPKR